MLEHMLHTFARRMRTPAQKEAAVIAMPYTKRWKRIAHALESFGQEGEFIYDGIGRSTIDLTPYVSRYALQETDPADYSLWEHANNPGYSWNDHYLDTSRGFFIAANLERRTEPLAVAGFTIAQQTFSGAIEITQLQSLPREKKAGTIERSISTQGYKLLRRLRWEQMMVHIIEDWASAAGFEQIRIRPSCKNKYYHPRSTSPQQLILHQRLLQRYDGTAAHMGYHEPNNAIPSFWKALPQER